MVFGLAAAQAQQDACKHRGDLDTPFCDEDGDLLADTPNDAKRQKHPDPLFFTNLPIDYKQDWELIRHVARESGQAFTRTAFEREKSRAEAASRK